MQRSVIPVTRVNRIGQIRLVVIGRVIGVDATCPFQRCCIDKLSVWIFASVKECVYEGDNVSRKRCFPVTCSLGIFAAYSTTPVSDFLCHIPPTCCNKESVESFIIDTRILAKARYQLFSRESFVAVKKCLPVPSVALRADLGVVKISNPVTLQDKRLPV